MIEHDQLSVASIRAWLQTTQGVRGLGPESRVVAREVKSIRSELSGDIHAVGLNESDGLLCALSVLSNDLADERSASRYALQLAESAFHLLSKRHPQEEEFGELSELLCRFAFLAWRHSRRLDGALASQIWAERFDQALLQESTNLDYFRSFLRASASERSTEATSKLLSDSECLFAICALFREERNSFPERVADDAVAFFRIVESDPQIATIGDERSFFLTQLAMTAAVSFRWTGEMGRSGAWLDIAERHGSRTIVPELARAELELNRLIELQEQGRWAQIVNSLPELQRRMRAVGMLTCLAKSEILLSDSLKLLGLVEESVPPLRRCLESPALVGRPVLRAVALLFLADSYTILCRSAEAEQCLRTAASILQCHEGPTAVAHLTLVIGERFRKSSSLENALGAYNAARVMYEELGLATLAAYARLLVAEVFLALDRDADARAEIVSALPAIEGAGLVAKGAAALALLRESVRRERVDAKSVLDVASQLKGLPR
jgi:hypothetical protein